MFPLLIDVSTLNPRKVFQPEAKKITTRIGGANGGGNG
jgi:hypothetical protein